jgi:hypothetical protein
MGILKGDVDILGLGTMLQALAMNGREGVFTLVRGMDRKSIYFGPHGMRLLSTTMRRINKLGKILLRRRKLTPDELRLLLEEQRMLGWKLGQIAVNSGKVTKKDLEEALREQLQEEIFDMFMWSDAAFEFADGPPRHKSDNPLAELTLDMNITSLVLEAARRQDELLNIRTLVSDESMSLVRTAKEIAAAALGEDLETVDAILPLINGKRSVSDIVNASVYPRFLTLRAVYALVVNGYAKAINAKGTTIRVAPRPAKPG